MPTHDWCLTKARRYGVQPVGPQLRKASSSNLAPLSLHGMFSTCGLANQKRSQEKYLRDWLFNLSCKIRKYYNKDNIFCRKVKIWEGPWPLWLSPGYSTVSNFDTGVAKNFDWEAKNHWNDVIIDFCRSICS